MYNRFLQFMASHFLSIDQQLLAHSRLHYLLWQYTSSPSLSRMCVYAACLAAVCLCISPFDMLPEFIHAYIHTCLNTFVIVLCLFFVFNDRRMYLLQNNLHQTYKLFP